LDGDRRGGFEGVVVVLDLGLQGVVQVADDTVLKLRLDHGPGDENTAANVIAHDLLVFGKFVKRPGQVVAAADEDLSRVDAAVPNHVNTAGLGQSTGFGIEGEKPVKVSRLGACPMGVGQFHLSFCKG